MQTINGRSREARARQAHPKIAPRLCVSVATFVSSVFETLFGFYNLSKIPAAPMPPPTHIVTIP